ncbi:MAG: Ca2+-binding EF-hand superfamily protein [Celeribacter sp.]|jgi:hypothetical protein
MNKLTATLAALGILTVPALAQSTLEDADGNGTFSFSELSIAYPQLTEERFVMLDTDESGDVSPTELSAGMDAGLLED